MTNTEHADPSRICYVFAVGRHAAGLTEAAARTTGQDGAAVRTVVAGDLAALVCSVPADAFGEVGMKAQLEDLERLEAVARAHHAVVATAYEHTTVLPMRLATVYLDEARTAQMLRERGEEFRALLDRLERHTEWGVKVYADPSTVPAEEPEPVGGGAAAPDSPGRAYLQRRRAGRRDHQRAYRAAGTVVARIAEAAGELVAAKVAHRPQQGELATGPGENVANDAYLVPTGRGEEFRRAVDAAAQGAPGVHVAVTGPWAPYSFATPPQPGGEGSRA